MNKKLTLPISLLACLVLLVGCSGAKKNVSSPDDNNSSEQEIPPEPEKDKGLEIFESLDAAKFVDFGELNNPSAVVKEIEQSGKGLDFDYLSTNATKFYELQVEAEYDFEAEETSYTIYRSGVDKYSNDIAKVFHEGKNGFNLNNVGNVLTDYMFYDYITVHKDDTQYLRVHLQASGSDPATFWEIDDFDYANDRLADIYSDLYLDLNDYYYTKIGDYHYFSYVYMDNNSYSFTDYYGDDRYTFQRMTIQDVYKFDAEYRFLGYYLYEEVTVDHNLFSGQLLDSPMVVYRSLKSNTCSYDNNPYPDEKGLIASIPTHQIINSEISYKVGDVTLDENGKISVSPAMPNNFSTETNLEYVDDKHYALALAFLPSNNEALQLSSLVVRDTILQGEDKGSNKTYTISFENKSVVEKIATAMGATYELYGGTYYFILEADGVYGFKVVVPAFEEPTADNIEIIPYKPSMILLP